MSVACFWPCDDPQFRREHASTDHFVLLMICCLLILFSKRLASSRTVWICTVSALTIAFSFAMLSYLVFSRSDARSNFAWVAMGTIASFQAAAAYVFKSAWMEEYGHWALGYASVFGTIGFALARGFIPQELDMRIVVVLETLVCVLGAVGCAYVIPSPVVNLAMCVLTLYIKIRWMDTSSDEAWKAMGEAYTRDQVRTLMSTPAFLKWMEKNHMRLRKLK